MCITRTKRRRRMAATATVLARRAREFAGMDKPGYEPGEVSPHYWHKRTPHTQHHSDRKCLKHATTRSRRHWQLARCVYTVLG